MEPYTFEEKRDILLDDILLISTYYMFVVKKGNCNQSNTDSIYELIHQLIGKYLSSIFPNSTSVYPTCFYRCSEI